MGRIIKVDIDDLFEILGTLEDGGYSIPTIVFDIIDDCNLDDIARYASHDNTKSLLEDMLEGYLGMKAIAAMREQKHVHG